MAALIFMRLALKVWLTIGSALVTGDYLTVIFFGACQKDICFGLTTAFDHYPR
jgi:hypothetical protein